MRVAMRGTEPRMKIEGWVYQWTDRAIRLATGVRLVWLPQSLVEIDDRGVAGCTVTVPVWLARKKGLV